MVDVQLVGQVTTAAEWPQLLAYWEKRYPSGTATWPRRVDPRAYVMNLWPLYASRVVRAVGVGGDVTKRQPKTMVCGPALTVFNPHKTPTDPATILAVICAIWFEGICKTDYPTMRFAPPILERWATAAVSSHEKSWTSVSTGRS